MYASAQTVVRPCSENKLLISELETNSCPFLKKSIYGWTLINMDRLDKDILNRIQSKFPVTSRPFKVLGEEFSISEAAMIRRVERLVSDGYIRRLGASFDSKRLGFTSTLCAARVPSEKLEDFVDVLHSYQGITHNYRRVHEYNIWFTFIGESKEEILNNLADISKKTGIRDILNLPAKKSFKINVEFEI